MYVIKPEALEKMSFERLKNHRRSVLAHIGATFYEYTPERVPNEKHGSEYFQYCIDYRNTVNYFYDKKKPQ